MKTITCIKCETPRDEEDFNWQNKAKGKRHSWCKECTKALKKRSYKKHKEGHIKLVQDRREAVIPENRRKVYEYLSSNACVDCKEPDPIVLQFDHVRGDKREAVSVLLHRGCGWDTLKEEINKCEVRCANCHARRTAKMIGNWKTELGPYSSIGRTSLS